MGKRQGMHYFCRIGAQKNHPEGWLRCGAADEARTRYLHLGKVALYQMSYGRRSGAALHRLGMPPIGIEPMTRGFSVPCSTD